MKTYSTIWAYLWDLEDEGIEEAVRRCKEEMGLDAVSVATSYHTFQQLRPRHRGGKLLVSEEAAVYFLPDATLYGETSIKPHVASLARRDNPLERLANACQVSGLDLISWTVCLHNSHLAVSHPDCAQQTAYGDRLGWILCPGADDVRAYVVALCRDLVENYGVRRLELESCNFGGYGHSHYHVKDGVDLGNIGNYLFSLSFSPGCMEKARIRGIDAEGVRMRVREQLDRVFDSGRPLEGEIGEFVSEEEELAGFQQMREDLVTSLVREIKEATGVEVSFLLMGDRWRAGIRPAQIAREADLVEILAYTDSPDAVEKRVQETMADLDEPGRLVLGLQAYHPCARSADGLWANVERGLELGVKQFSYYNYGIAPRPCLDWVKHCTECSSAYVA